MKILLGTTNHSKMTKFSSILENYDVEIVTLNDLNITTEPEETGSTPIENSKIKAEYYGKIFPYVICDDSGLYFDCLDIHDKRQPGLHIRSPYGTRLNDEEMIKYYSSLIKSLGGKVFAYYRSGITANVNGTIYTFEDTDPKFNGFFMVDTPHPSRHEGWPLDSLSVNAITNKYFVDGGHNRYEETSKSKSTYQERLADFFAKTFKLEKKQ